MNEGNVFRVAVKIEHWFNSYFSKHIERVRRSRWGGGGGAVLLTFIKVAYRGSTKILFTLSHMFSFKLFKRTMTAWYFSHQSLSWCHNVINHCNIFFAMSWSIHVDYHTGVEPLSSWQGHPIRWWKMNKFIS